MKQNNNKKCQKDKITLSNIKKKLIQYIYKYYNSIIQK